MDYLAWIVGIICSIVLIYYNYVIKRKSKNLPPGPFPLPIIGSLYRFMYARPFQKLGELVDIYGPIMCLKLGSQDVIVISSGDMAKEVLFKNDLVCSGKAEVQFSAALNHNEYSMAYLPVGPKWRMMRRICKEHIFSMQKMEGSAELREAKLEQLTSYLEDCSKSRRSVDVGDMLAVTLINLISSTLFTKDFCSYDSTTDYQDMKKFVTGIKDALQPSLTDFFPSLKRFLPKHNQRTVEMHYVKALVILDEIINERLKSRGLVDYSKKKDLLEVLLDLYQQDDSDINLVDMKHLLLDLIAGGAGTTEELIQWAMVELLRDPDKMSKLKKELKSVVGDKRQPMESDIPKLSYLNALIKETLRYHPLTPPFFPRKAEADVQVNGYTIPKGTTILINQVGIFKDQNTWRDSQSFRPERFLNEHKNIDYKGQNFEFIPFSAGRRGCPGLPLAHLMSHITLARLVYNFDFIFHQKEGPDQLDTKQIDWVKIHKIKSYTVIPVSLTS